MGLLFIRLYEYHGRAQPGTQRLGSSTVTLIEEAHRLFPPRLGGRPAAKQAKSASLERGDFLQHARRDSAPMANPSYSRIKSCKKLVADAIKNTNLKIAHRIVHQDNSARSLGQAHMNLTSEQMDELGLLDDGQAFVHFQSLPPPFTSRSRSRPRRMGQTATL